MDYGRKNQLISKICVKNAIEERSFYYLKIPALTLARPNILFQSKMFKT